MNKTKHHLIKKARQTYSKISPCGTKTSLFDCFTIIENGKKLVFWFNTPDNSTHVMVGEIDG